MARTDLEDDRRLPGRVMPFVWLLLMGVMWGATVSLAKIATEGGAHPLGLTLWQGIGGGTFLLALCWSRRRRLPLDPTHLKFYLVCGLLGVSIPGTLLFYAAPRLPAGIISIVIATVPLFTYALAYLCRADSFSFRRIVGIAVGLLAILLLIAPETGLPQRDMVPWVFVTLVSTTCYALENIYVALRRPEATETLVVVSGMLFMGALTISPLVIATGTFVPLGGAWTEVELSILAMIALNALAYAIFLHVVQSSGPVFASQAAYIITLSGVLWGMIIFGERHSLWIWLSLVVVLVGLALVTPRERNVA